MRKCATILIRFLTVSSKKYLVLWILLLVSLPSFLYGAAGTLLGRYKSTEILRADRVGERYRSAGELEKAARAYEDKIRLLEEKRDLFQQLKAYTENREMAEWLYDRRGREQDAYRRELLHEDLAVQERKIRELLLRDNELRGYTQEFLHLSVWDTGYLNSSLKETIKQIGVTHRELGLIYEALGQTARALDEFKKALTINQFLKSPGRIVRNLNNIGLSFQSLGNYDSALEYFNKTLDAAIKYKMTVSISIAWNNIGNCYLELGQTQKALECFKNALAAKKKYDPEGDRSFILTNIATIHQINEEYDPALKLYSKALQQVKNLHLKSLILGNLGNIHRQLNEPAVAIKYLNRALEIDIKRKDTFGSAMRLTCLAGLYREMKDVDRAWVLVSDALGALGVSMSQLSNIDESTPTPNSLFLHTKYREKAWPIFVEAGNILFEKSKTGTIKEKRILLKNAHCFLALGVSLIEESRGKIGTSVETRMTFLTDKIDAYDLLVTTLVRLHQLEDKARFDALAFHYSEKKKARAFLDILTESRAKKLAKVPDEILTKEKSLELQEGALKTNFAKAYSEGNKEKIDNLQRQIDDISNKIANLRKEIEKKYPGYGNLKYPKIAGIEDIQKILDKDSAFLEYYVTDDFVILWLITKDKAKLYKFPNDKIDEKITKYRKAILPGLKTDEELASYLYASLIGNSLDNLNAKRITIAPDGDLYKLPFGSIGKKDKDGKFHYLVEDYNISYIQSASIFKMVKEKGKPKRKKEPFFAMGDPVYENLPEAKKKPETEKEVMLIAKALRQRGGATVEDFEKLGINLRKRFYRLPESGDEVRTIGKLLRSKKEYIKTREKATEDIIKSLSGKGILKNFKYLHFSCHGELNEKVPALSCIVLTQDEDPKEDGFLTVGEVFGLNMDCELICLSACQTGLGKIERGEGLVGLTRAFMYAGTPSILVSLWSVESKSTEMMMESFYRYLKQGLAKDEALRRAQIELWAKNTKDRHGRPISCELPLFWAPFVLYGDWK